MAEYKTPEQEYLDEHGQPGKDHTAQQDRKSNTAAHPELAKNAPSDSQTKAKPAAKR